MIKKDEMIKMKSYNFFPIKDYVIEKTLELYFIHFNTPSFC